MSKLIICTHSKTHRKQNQKQTNYVYSAFQYCHKDMIQKYNTQRQCLHLEIIQNILDCEQPVNKSLFRIPEEVRIRVLDHKFNDQFEYLVKYYETVDSNIEIGQMCEYYKYYMQEPIVATAQHFTILYCYSQKKKEIAYKKIKKLLNYSDKTSNQQNYQSDSKKTKGLIKQSKCQQFLNGISFSQNQSSKDQSQLFGILQQKFIKKYGNSSEINMKQIDKLYKFQIKNDNSQIKILKRPTKSNIIKNDNTGNIKKQLFKNFMQQSTNNSTIKLKSYCNIQKSYIHQELTQIKAMSEKRRLSNKKIESKVSLKAVSNKKRKLNPYRSSCQFDKRVQPIGNKQQIINHNRKKLRKRSCQHFETKKFKTIGIQNSPPNFQKLQISQTYNQQNPNTIQQFGFRKLKNKLAFSNINQINSYSNLQNINHLQSNFLVGQRQKATHAQKITSPSFLDKNDIKNTIIQFKNKIRHQIRQFTQYDKSAKPNKQSKQKQKISKRQNTQKQKSIKKMKNQTTTLNFKKKNKKPNF